MTKIIYPKVEDIVLDNMAVLGEIKVKKADQPKILSELKLVDVINACKSAKGDLYHKAATLLENLVKNHSFASGNRRTALATTIKFLVDNHKKTKIKNDPEFARVLTGLRALRTN